MTVAIHRESASKPAEPLEGLYVIPTPIGNLRDITLRALDVLDGVDLIACEDTRITQRLLNAYGLKTPMTAYHDHNAARQRPRLIRQLAEGGTIALLSDAGTPMISDPGYKLVRAAIEAEHAVTVLPGASAVLTGLLASGLPTDRFMFAGFAPTRTNARRRFFADLTECPASLIFFESPKRLASTLADMAQALGDRPAAVARELTKRYEEIRRGDLSGLAEFYAEQPAPKGEIVIIVGPPGAAAELTAAEIDAAIRAALLDRGVKQAAADVSQALGLPRRQIYQRALQLRNHGEDD